MENRFDDFVERVGKIMTPTDVQAKAVVATIREKLVNYIKENKMKSLVLGVSGGLDSSVVAAIANENITGIPLITMSIPLTSNDAHKEQAKYIGQTYGSYFDVMDEFETEINGKEIHTIINETINTNDRLARSAGFGEFDYNVTQGNIKSRLRMMMLYDMARKCQGMVLGTGNWSEDHAIFFYTLGGDGQVDYSPIKGIGKGWEMPIIAKALGVREDIINQKPSDGLSVTKENSDEAQIGATYKEVDVIINCYKGNFSEEIQEEFKEFIMLDKVQKVIKRHNHNSFKGRGEVSIERGENGLVVNWK